MYKSLKIFAITLILVMGIFTGTQCAKAETVISYIDLPAPNTTGGESLTYALKNRKTSQKFSQKPLDMQTLSDLLWAANGINNENGNQTASKAVKSAGIPILNIYVALPNGVYKYDNKENKLLGYSKEDLRPIVGKYPLILLYVANLSMENRIYSTIDSAFMAQNVSLFAAANNLNTAFLYRVNTSGLNLKLNLSLMDEVLFAQAVGYPIDVK